MGEILLWAALAGIGGTGLGGLIGTFVPGGKGMGDRVLLPFSGGVMLAVSLAGLLPEAAAKAGFWPCFFGALCGVGLLMAADLLARGSIGRSGLIFFAIALHNFPEGIAIGATGSLGLWVALLMGLHNVPEGISVAVPLREKGKGLLQTVGLCALCGAPTVAGAFSGALFGGLGEAACGFSLSLAAGAMIYVTLLELFPDAYQSGSRRVPALFGLCGALTGAFFLS